MHLKTILTIISPFVGYGCLMGYLWYQVQSSAEQMIQAAAPLATISYDSVHLSPLGDEVGLDGISIQPAMTSDRFHIDSLRLNVPHVGYFFDAQQSVSNKSFPEHMAIELKRAQLDLGSEVFDLAIQAQQTAANSEGDNISTFLTSLDALGCGNTNSFSLQDYRNMGVDNIIADASILMEHDKGAHHGNFTITATLDGLYEIEARMELNTRPGALKSIYSSNMPKTTISYRDTGLYELRNQYCAEINNSSIEEYVEQHLKELSVKLGTTIPAETLKHYRKYMLNGGQVSMHFNPSEEFDPNTLSYYKPADIITMLGLGIQLDGNPIALDEFSWEPAGKVASAKSSNKQERTVTNPRRAQRPIVRAATTTASNTGTYKDVTLDDAVKHINRMAEVTTAAGKVRRGILSQVKNDYIYLEIKHSAGSLTYPVEFKLVDRLRVRY